MKSVTLACMAFARTLSLAALRCRGAETWGRTACWEGREHGFGAYPVVLMRRLFLIPAGCLQVEGQGWGDACSGRTGLAHESEQGGAWLAEEEREQWTFTHSLVSRGPCGVSSATTRAWRAAVGHCFLSEEQRFQSRHFHG